LIALSQRVPQSPEGRLRPILPAEAELGHGKERQPGHLGSFIASGTRGLGPGEGLERFGILPQAIQGHAEGDPEARPVGREPAGGLRLLERPLIGRGHAAGALHHGPAGQIEGYGVLEHGPGELEGLPSSGLAQVGIGPQSLHDFGLD
jgi:hypothetical protein